MIDSLNPMEDSEVRGSRIASGLIRASTDLGEDETDSRLLHDMLATAESYISKHSWCKAVLESYFGGGVGGVFAVFLLHIQPSRSGIDPWIWTMVGDVPSAYLPICDCDSPAEAFRTYMEGMGRWVELARKGQTGSASQGVPPINVPATPEWAQRLQERLDALESVISPLFEEGYGTPAT